MKAKSKKQTPRQLMKRLTTELAKLGYAVSSRERSPGAEKAWLDSDKPLDWAKVRTAAARIEAVTDFATSGGIRSVSRSFEVENQSGDDAADYESRHGHAKNQLFVAVTRPTKAGKAWDRGMDVWRQNNNGRSPSC